MLNEIREVGQELWGIPDCDNCKNKEDCFTRTLGAIVEVCSKYEKTETAH